MHCNVTNATKRLVFAVGISFSRHGACLLKSLFFWVLNLIPAFNSFLSDPGETLWMMLLWNNLIK